LKFSEVQLIRSHLLSPDRCTIWDTIACLVASLWAWLCGCAVILQSKAGAHWDDSNGNQNRKSVWDCTEGKHCCRSNSTPMDLNRLFQCPVDLVFFINVGVWKPSFAWVNEGSETAGSLLAWRCNVLGVESLQRLEGWYYAMSSDFLQAQGCNRNEPCKKKPV